MELTKEQRRGLFALELKSWANETFSDYHLHTKLQLENEKQLLLDVADLLFEKPIQEQNEPLTLEQFKELNGEPVWIEFLPKWLIVHEDCSKISKWYIVKMYDKHIDPSVMGFPLMWNEKNYNKYWIAYEHKKLS